MLYLVRHGRTEANAGGRLQGRLDLPLDAEGRAQVEAVGRTIGTPDVVVCSSLLRARETAAVFGIEPIVDDRWIEMAYGDFEGLRMDDIPPEQWRQWSTDHDFAPAGGESLRSVAQRVFEACEELQDTFGDRTVVVVSHATPIKLAMAWALSAPIDINWRTFIDQASITTVKMRNDRPVLTGFNLVPAR